MTIKDCLDKTRKLINYYSISGDPIHAQDTALRDYDIRARAAIDTAQKELAARRPQVRHICFTQHGIRPLQAKSGFHRVNGQIVLEAVGAGAFSMLCDGAVSIRFEAQSGAQWTCLYSNELSGTGTMEPVSASVVLANEKMLTRLTICGDGAFVSDIGLFRELPEEAETPIYGSRRWRVLPEDFGRMLDCRPKGQLGAVMRAGFAYVDDGKIGFPWDFDGKIEIEYTAVPYTIDDSTDECTSLAVGADAAEVIPYYAAAMLLTDENPKLSEYFLALYTEKLRAIETLTGFSVRNTFFAGGRR